MRGPEPSPVGRLFLLEIPAALAGIGIALLIVGLFL